MTRRHHLDTKETAALVRAAVAESFPGIKFSVRISRYSMGSSITISWTDGPTSKAVEAVTNTFRGDYFDGMTDSSGHIYHTLDGEPVHFGGSLSTRRETSAAAEAAMMGAWQQLERYEQSRLADRLGVWLREWDYRDGYAWRSILHAWDFYGKPAQPSATVARVRLEVKDTGRLESDRQDRMPGEVIPFSTPDQIGSLRK